jgi:ornithine cyclodeaminase/alanine dehydrogenase-like protein (mu-crystallin family)
LRTLTLTEIRRVLDYRETIGLMREALLADCDTPMPMHLDIAPESAEVHIKASYARGGPYFAMKVASTYPKNRERGLPSGNGMMLLCSAETGAPLAVLADDGYLTDVRTAATSAMIAREVGRTDRVLGIVGSGIQARLTARLHALVLPLERIVLWGRTRDRAQECARELADVAPVEVVDSPAAVAREARLIVTVTASRAPLLRLGDLQPGTHITAVGSDGPGKQELDTHIVRRADWILADSVQQCERLGELQFAKEQTMRARELRQGGFGPGRLTVADLTGLGVEDLFIARHVYERSLG